MKAGRPILSVLHVVSLLVFVGFLGTCSLDFREEVEEGEETNEPLYKLMATGFGDLVDVEWGFKRYAFFSDDPPRYQQLCEVEYQGVDWWQLEIPVRDVRQQHRETLSGCGYLYLRACNPNGGPVATRIILIDQSGAENILQEDSSAGSVESVTEIDVATVESYSACPGCSGGHSFGGKVICAELYRQGLMTETIFEADEAFGRYLRDHHKDVLVGYYYWASPVVKRMQKSRRITKIVCFAATPWSREMAHIMGARDKGSIAGKILMLVGVPICRIIGRAVIWAGNTSLRGATCVFAGACPDVRDSD
jgi:hypothetical protein